MRKLVFTAALLFGLVSCANPITTASKTATQGAVDTLATPKSQLDIKTAVAAARDEALGETSRAKVAILADDLNGDVLRTRNAALDPAFVAPVREQLLGNATQARVAALREELVGQPLRDDVAQLLAEMKPLADDLAASLTASVTKSLDTTAQAEVSKYRLVVIGLTVCVSVLLLSLGLCVWLVRSHHKLLQKIALQVKT
jgi:hypothetical protein